MAEELPRDLATVQNIVVYKQCNSVQYSLVLAKISLLFKFVRFSIRMKTMVKFCAEWKFVESENFDEYLKGSCIKFSLY